jgi:hypothetical protein
MKEFAIAVDHFKKALAIDENAVAVAEGLKRAEQALREKA